MAPKSGERRLQILQTLAAMLENPRGEKVTTAALAARLDVSEAALYRHFASKAQMFEGLIEFIENAVFSLINQILEREAQGRAQAARIVAPREGKWAAIGGGGTENVLVQGFHVTGGHNGIQFSQNGYDYHDTVNNIAIYGNVIDNPMEDGVKINGGNNVVVADNVITNCYDEGIDLLGITNGRISHNSVSKVESRTGAISVKGGSDQILIDGNMISDIMSDGVLVGGWTSPRMASRPGYEGFEARNVRVTGNVVERVGKRAVNIMAAQRAEISGNYLDVSQGYGAVIELGRNHPRAATALYSSDVAISDNQFSRNAGKMRSMQGTGAIRFLNNRGGGRPAMSAGPRRQALPFPG